MKVKIDVQLFFCCSTNKMKNEICMERKKSFLFVDRICLTNDYDDVDDNSKTHEFK